MLDIWKLNKNGKVDERSVHPVQVLLEEETKKQARLEENQTLVTPFRYV